MTVTVNATGTEGYQGSSTTSYNYTGITIAAGSNTALVVLLAWDTGGTKPTSITATWDSGGSSQAMTQIVEQADAGGHSAITIFGLRNPTTGNKTLALSWTNNSRLMVGAVAFDGVDVSSNAAAFPHTAVGQALNPSVTVNLTSATGNKVAWSIENGSGVGTPIPTGTTVYSDNVNGSNIAAGAFYDNGATTVAIGWTAIESSLAGIDIAAFAGAAANPNNQFNWPVPRSPDYPLFLRSWVSQPQSPFPPFTAPVLMPPLIVDWGISDRRTFEPARIQYNATLLSQPAATYMPGRVLDWGTVPATSTAPALTWTQRPQLTAVVVAGPLPKNQYDWPVPTAPRPAADLRTFINDLQFQLIGKDKLPVRQQDWPVPPAPRPASDLRTFINDSPIQLIGKDKLPVRQQIWPVPIAPDYSVSLRSFLASPGRPLISAPVQPPFSQDDWPLPIAAVQPIRTWTQGPTIATPVVAPTFMPGRVSEWGMWERVPFSAAPIANLTLSLPEAAVTVTYVFREPYYSPQWAGPRFETWTTSVNLALRAVPPAPKPFTQTDWPITPAARQPDRTYQRAFPPELIGQDRLPFRQQSWPLTPATEFSNALRSIGFRSPALDVAAPRPFVQSDWPLTPWQVREVGLRTFINKTPTQLIGKDRLPIRQQDWPLPIAPRPAADLRTYIAQSPIRLIGKDRLPFRQMHWPVPLAPLEFHTLRSITQGRVIYGGEVAPIPPEPPLPPPEVIHSVRAHADAYYGVFYADEIKGRADFSRAKGSNDEEAAN